MLTIGRFADASGLTVKALRHYDEIGLLAPAEVDARTGYRYYDASQVQEAVAIRRLRALEMPLDEIRELLGRDTAAAREGLAAHAYRVALEAHDKQMLLIELDALVEGGDSPLTIEIREQAELRLAAQIRHVHQDAVATEIDAMLDSVDAWLRAKGRDPVGPAMALFRGAGGRAEWHLVEAGWPVDSGVEGDESTAVYVYPASRAATYEHHGDLSQLHPIAQRFIATVLGHGHNVTQPIRMAYPSDNHALLIWPIE
jgi:DNA-binding transcriptional MerR regulator